MKTLDIPPVMLIAAAAGAAALLWVWSKKKPGESMAAAAGAAAVGVVADVAGGTVLGIGDVVGVPRTDMTECEKAKAEGRTWDASFACPAGDFLGWVWK